MKARIALSRFLVTSFIVLTFGAVAVTQTVAANKNWDGGGADAFWQTGNNWDGNTPPAASDSLAFTGTTRLNSTNNYTAGTVFNGLGFASPAGAFTLRGNQITLGGDISDNQTVVTETVNLALALSATRTVNVGTDGALILGGAISGTGSGLIKIGDGRLTLGAANTFSGPLTINAGAVSISSDANLGAAPGSPTAGNIVINGGVLAASANVTVNGNRGVAIGPASGTGQGTFDVAGNATLAYGGVIANNGGGTGGLTKLSYGGLTLSGANTYAGPTLIKDGTVTLDFTQATSPANNIISSSSVLTFGGVPQGLNQSNIAALILNGKAGVTNSQAFNGSTVTFGPTIIRANSGSGGAAHLALGLLSHTAGGVVVVMPPSLTGGQGNITTTATNVNGIIGGWATISDGTIPSAQLGITIGTNFASVDASGNIVSYSGHTIYSSGNLSAIAGPAKNIRIDTTSSGDVVVDTDGAGATTDINTLTFNRNASVNTSVRIGTNNTLRLGRYGAILKPDGPTLTWVLGSGSSGGANGVQNAGILTAGGADNTDGEIIFNVNSTSSSTGSLNVESQITDNGTGKVTVIKTGTSSMKLRGHNTYSGGTYVLQGRFQLAGSEIGTGNPDACGTGPIYVLPGSYLFCSGIGAGNAITNDIFVAGLGNAQEAGIGAIRLGNGLTLSGTITLASDSRISGGNGTATVISGKITGPYAMDLGSTATINANFTLSNTNNDWSGTTTLNARNSATTSTIINGASEVIPNGFGRGNVVMNGNTSTGTINWNLNGFSETINGLSTTANNPVGCVILNNGAAPSVLTVGDNDQSGTFGGLINNGSGGVAVTKIGGGLLTLTGASGYAGDTAINGGTLELSGAGSIASSANIFVNSGGTLDVSGATGGFSSAGPVNVNGGALVVRSAGSPGITALNLTNARLRLSTLGGTNVAATALNLSGPTNLIDVISVGFITSYPTQFTVIKYSGVIGGAFNLGLGAVPSSTTVGYVSNNTANSSVDLVLLDGPKPLTWTGAKGRDWDIATTTNWLAFGTAPIGFVDADSVIFGDGASTNVVNLTTVLTPGAVIVSNQALNYTFTGPGYVSGFAGLLKDGSGTLTLANTGVSDFKGGLTVSNGTLTLATDNAISGGATIGPSGTVQVGTNGTSGTLPAGTVVNDGTLILNRSDDFAMSSPITGSGVVRKINANSATLGGVSADYTGLILVAQGTLKAGGALGGATATTIVSNAATLDVNGQTLNATVVRVRGTGVGGNGAIVNNGAESQNAQGNVILEGNTTFGGTGRWDIRGGPAPTLSTESSPFNLTKTGSNQFSLVGVAVDAALGDINVQQGIFSVETSTASLGDSTKTLTVASGATLQLFQTTAAFDKRFVLNGDGTNTTLNIANGNANTLAGTMTLNGNCIFNMAGNTTLTLGGAVGGTGNLIKTGTGTNILSGVVSYNGATTVSNGVLLVNSAKGAAGGITVHSGGVLGGYSSLAEPVVIAANGVLSPGDAVIPTSALVISNTLTLAGTVQMDVLKSGGQFQNDVLTNLTTLTLGGRLQLNVDTNGEALANGDAIKLFSFTTASGNVAEIVPATPAAGLFWDQSQLPVNGTLRVTATPTTPPEIETVIVVGPDIIFGGGGGSAGARYVVLTSTNVALPLSSWDRISTNDFEPNGRFSVTNGIQAGITQKFYSVQLFP